LCRNAGHQFSNNVSARTEQRIVPAASLKTRWRLEVYINPMNPHDFPFIIQSHSAIPPTQQPSASPLKHPPHPFQAPSLTHQTPTMSFLLHLLLVPTVSLIFLLSLLFSAMFPVLSFLLLLLSLPPLLVVLCAGWCVFLVGISADVVRGTAGLLRDAVRSVRGRPGCAVVCVATAAVLRWLCS
jgi:hypothetical protein